MPMVLLPWPWPLSPRLCNCCCLLCWLWHLLHLCPSRHLRHLYSDAYGAWTLTLVCLKQYLGQDESVCQVWS